MPMRTPPWARFYPEGVAWDYAPPSGTMPALFAGIVDRHGPRVAIDYGGEEITYHELGRRAAMVADALRRRGVGAGHTVALYLPNCPWHPCFFFGTLLAGARVTHLSPLDAHRELIHKCADSGARWLVTLSTPVFAQMAARLRREGVVDRIVLCDDPVSLAGSLPPPPFEDAVSHAEFVAGSSDALVLPVVAPGDVALLQYTGGTTGKPKAAMLSHANLVAATHIYEYLSGFDAGGGPEAVVLLCSPLFHIMGLTSIMMRRFKEGARLVLCQRFDVAQVLEAVERKRVTAFSGVPTVWIAILNHPGIERRNLVSLRHVASGGAPLPVEVYRRVHDLLGLRLRGGWGMTETSPCGTSVPADLPDAKIGTIGIPLPGVRMEIVAVDDPRRVLPPGEVGEMRIRSPTVMAGYWNRPEETAAAFVDGWFLTGDVGRMDEDGFFYLVDRKKDLILSGGFNVYPQAIEEAIHEHPSVAEVVVIGVPDAYRGEAAKAFVVLRAGEPEFSLDELKAFLAERLGRHELPQYLAFRTELPRTPVGKQSRRALRDQEMRRLAETGDAP